jgi:undecaprenyl-diphosphatase
VTAQTSTAPRTTNRPAGRNLSRIAAVIGAALLFAILMLGVRARWVPLEAVDGDLARALNRAIAPHPLAVGVMKFISVLGSRAVLIWLIAIATVLLVVRRQYRLAAFLVVAGVGSAILDPTLKQAIGRLRPVVAHPVAVGGGNSFPSGHALGSFVSYGALLLVFLPALPRRARRPVIIGLAVLVGLIGFSRLALGVHFLSDVVGAWCLGVAWLGLTTYVFELHRHEAGRRVTRPVTEGLEPEAATDLRPADRTVSSGALGGWLAAAGAVVAWVLTFGLLCAIGIPLAHYRGGNGNVLGDTTIPHFLAAHRTATLNRISYLGSEAGNTHMILAVGLIGGAAALAAIRRWRAVVFLLAVMFGELTLFLAAAAIVGRARPDVPHLDGPLPTSSFPSGHVAATVLLYAAFTVLVLPRTSAWWRWVVAAIAVLMPVWVGLSRMYRGMHHPTDLLGSLILAACWLAAMLYLIRPNIATVAAARTRPEREPAVAR